ncbi:hypothetical protein MBLNU13_g09892t1 [Cladosporium sp. NU13]
MTSSPLASPSKTSLAEEPLLPTYEQFQSTDAATAETLPEKTATADQIRDFLVHLLTSKRGLALDHARRVASKWTIGNGKELRSYPPSMYLDIFGREDGWVVYKEVKICILQAGQSKKTELSRVGQWIFLGISLAALGGVLFGFIHGIGMGSAALAFSMLPLLLITGLCAIGTMVSLGSETDPEKIVESELQSCLRKHSES